MLQDGATALHLAASGGKLEVVELLGRYGAAVDIRGKVTIFRCLPLLAVAEHLSFRDS
jgi:ankyrin repeat protein